MTDNLSFNIHDFPCVTTKAAFNDWIERCHAADVVCFDTETTGLEADTCDLVGLSLAIQEGSQINACYVPIGHQPGLGKQLPLTFIYPPVKKLLESGKPIVGANILFDMRVLAQRRYGIRIANAHDTQLQSYALTGNQHFTHGMDALAERVLKYDTIKFSDIVDADRGVPDFSYVRHDVATKYAAEDGAVTLLIAKILQKRLKDNGLWGVYNDIDRPLLPVLLDMKLNGIDVDFKHLSKLDRAWSPVLRRLEKQAHKQAGMKFNLRSPKQVGGILYTPVEEGGKFGLRVEAYTDSGAPAVDKEALENYPGVPLVETLVEFKKYATLMSTFVRGLPDRKNKKTGRVHTSLNITSTKTRRLSSSEPNLQNIPVRTDEGQQLRVAFIAGLGCVLISCDYSQIEYRVLAHVTEDPYLVKAFNDGVDLHAKMAADRSGGHWEDYNNKADKTRYKIRTKFKNVNFAVVYGAGPGRVAYMSKIDKAEAVVTLAEHKEMCPRVYDWKEEVWAKARETLYVENLFGGRTYVKKINSKERALKGHAERLAINAPIQGGAAELIRIAMPKVRQIIVPAKTKLLLQVHDELVLRTRAPDLKIVKGECVSPIADAVAFKVKRAMETAADHLVQWKVPILAETGLGRNWSEAK